MILLFFKNKMEDRFREFESQEAESGSKSLLHQVLENKLSKRKERLNKILMEKGI